MRCLQCHPLITLGLSLLVFVALCGCGQKHASPKADATELERAFNLPASAAAGNEKSPTALAANAVAAIRDQDWVKAVPLLTELRTAKGLTPRQFEAVHNANGNAYVKLVELADKGDQNAKTTLEALSRAASRR